MTTEHELKYITSMIKTFKYSKAKSLLLKAPEWESFETRSQFLCQRYDSHHWSVLHYSIYVADMDLDTTETIYTSDGTVEVNLNTDSYIFVKWILGNCYPEKIAESRTDIGGTIFFLIARNYKLFKYVVSKLEKSEAVDVKSVLNIKLKHNRSWASYMISQGNLNYKILKKWIDLGGETIEETEDGNNVLIDLCSPLHTHKHDVEIIKYILKKESKNKLASEILFLKNNLYFDNVILVCLDYLGTDYVFAVIEVMLRFLETEHKTCVKNNIDPNYPGSLSYVLDGMINWDEPPRAKEIKLAFKKYFKKYLPDLKYVRNDTEGGALLLEYGVYQTKVDEVLIPYKTLTHYISEFIRQNKSMLYQLYEDMYPKKPSRLRLIDSGGIITSPKDLKKLEPYIHDINTICTQKKGTNPVHHNSNDFSERKFHSSDFMIYLFSEDWSYDPPLVFPVGLISGTLHKVPELKNKCVLVINKLCKSAKFLLRIVELAVKDLNTRAKSPFIEVISLSFPSEEGQLAYPKYGYTLNVGNQYKHLLDFNYAKKIN